MKPLATFVGAALLGAFMLVAAPKAQAQVGVNINIGVPAWGPQVPYGTQYYYIPEIDGYYDLYSQQYIVFQDGYWVPLPQLYGYDPYQFHPIIVDYRGTQPWLRADYYHQHYAYQPYHAYGPSRAGYYNGGYGYGSSYGRPRYDGNRPYSNGRNYYGRDYDDRGGRNQGPGRYNNPGPATPPQPGYTPPGPGRGNDRGGNAPGQGNPGPQGPGRNQGNGRDNSGGHGRGQG